MATRTASRAAAPLGLTSAVALVVGQVIAVGIFLTPGTMIRTLASPAGVLLVWAAMGGMAICGALCYGALAARTPLAGGSYIYLRDAYGPRIAFLYGWKCLLVMDPGLTAALAMGFSSYVAYIHPMTPGAQRGVAVAAIAAWAVVHVTGLGIGVRLMASVAGLKMLVLVALTGAALVSPAASWSHVTPLVTRHVTEPPLLDALSMAVVAAFFSFGGWWEVTRMAGDVRDPARTLPRALWMGLVLVTLAYAAATLAFLVVVPVTAVAEGQAIVAQVGEAIFGRSGATLLASIVILCVLGSLGTMLLIAPRLYVAMARDGLFPTAAAATHPTFGTPARAIATQAALASVLVMVGTFDTIVAYFVFVTVLFLAATVASVFVIARRDPAFRVPGHPWTTVIFLLLVAGLLVLLALGSPRQALAGTLVVAAALPFYPRRALTTSATSPSGTR